MDVRYLKYIVFLQDHKYNDHDGFVFSNHEDAVQWIIECFEEHYCDNAIVGTFYFELDVKSMMISKISSYSVMDLKKMKQLTMF